MKEYKYEGEPFYIEDIGGCEVKVSRADGDDAFWIRHSGELKAPYVAVDSNHDGLWHTATVNEALDSACSELLARAQERKREEVTPEQACVNLREFVRTLPDA